MNVAIIPARKGSKSLKDKNILPLGGKPLIVHTIHAALESALFEKVIVSTDSQEYANIAIQHGAIVPYLRSVELSQDTVPTSKVSAEILQYLFHNNEHYTYFSVLQVSSPLRNAKDIIDSYNLLVNKKADTVISVCESSYPKPWVQELPSDYSMRDFIPQEYYNMPRQSLPRYYKIHGAIFWCKVDTYHEQYNPFEQNSYAYVMPQSRSVDIDNDIDFELAKVLYEQQR